MMISPSLMRILLLDRWRMRGGSVKKIRSEEESDDESSTDDDKASSVSAATVIDSLSFVILS